MDFEAPAMANGRASTMFGKIMKNFSKAWVVIGVLVPVLMGAKGGCGGDDVSMGVDPDGEAGERATGGKDAAGGSSATSGGKASGGKTSSGGRTSSGGSSSVAGTTGVGGEPGSCDGYGDTSFEDEVVLRYFNDTDRVLFVGPEEQDCSLPPVFDLLSASGEKLSLGIGYCQQTCESFQTGHLGCPAVCPYAPVARIEPGASHDFKWAGTYLEMRDLPRECRSEDAPETQACEQRIQAPESRYAIRATAWTGVECPNDDCTYASWVIGDALKVSATLNYPEQKLVELHFE